MSPPDEPDHAEAVGGADPPIGPVARDALLRAIAGRLGADALAENGIVVPPEQVALASSAPASEWLLEAARVARGLDDLAALATEGRSEVALLALARLLTQTRA